MVGPVVVAGPLDTLIVTTDPLAARVAGAGVCVTTVPRGSLAWISFAATLNPARLRSDVAELCVDPITDGTGTARGPFETLSVTVESFLTSLPGAGTCRNTRSFGCREAILAVRPFKSASCTRTSAWATESPTTLGTSVLPGPLATTTVTDSPRSSSVPAAGAWERTLPGEARFELTRAWMSAV